MENQEITVKPLKGESVILNAIDSLASKFASKPASSYARYRLREKKVSDDIFNAISEFKLTPESNISNVVSTRNPDGTYIVNIKTERGRIHDQSKLLTAVTQAGYAIR